jgi:MFS transporter, CP family, cyanate transporter
MQGAGPGLRRHAGTLAPQMPAADASPPRAAAPPLLEPALVVMLAGVCAALHVGKLPPAIPVLQQALGITLVQAGFLLSMVQLAGMGAGVAFGALADALTPRRSMLIGLAVQAVASAAGGFAPGVAVLMALRACEGFGFLLVVLAVPALIRRLVLPERLNVLMGLWAAYMPLATTLALLAGPWVMAWLGWRAWWWLLAAVCAAMALWLARAVQVQAVSGASGASDETKAPARAVAEAGAAGTIATPPLPTLGRRLARTLAAPGPWLLAMSFAVYAAQWMALIGFLPTVYAQGGTALATAGLLTAVAAAVNMIGNIGAGRLLHAGVPPVRLLVIGFATMALCGLAAFLALPGGMPGSEPQAALPASWRFAAVLLFSGVGGLIPGTLFALAVRVAPGEGTLSTTMGWIMQWSALGQFTGPPLVAWVAARVGGWHLSWMVTGACALLGLALAGLLARQLRRADRAAA